MAYTNVQDAFARLKAMLRSVKFVFTPLAVGFLLYAGWSSREVLRSSLGGAEFGLIGLSVLIWIIMHLLSPVLAVIILKPCGVGVGYRSAFRIHAQRLPARYIPGGVWHTVTRVSDYRRLGVPASYLTAFVLLENLLAPCVTFLLGGAAIAYCEGWSTWGSAGMAAVGGAALGLVLALWSINRYILPFEQRMNLKAYALSIVVVAAFWLLAAAAFVLYLSAFRAVASEFSVLEIGGAYLFSWGVGYIAVFAPQGVGVFETVVGGILQGSVGLAGFAALAAGFRAIVLLADAIVWAASSVLTRFRFLEDRETHPSFDSVAEPDRRES